MTLHLLASDYDLTAPIGQPMSGTISVTPELGIGFFLQSFYLACFGQFKLNKTLMYPEAHFENHPKKTKLATAEQWRNANEKFIAEPSFALSRLVCPP